MVSQQRGKGTIWYGRTDWKYKHSCGYDLSSPRNSLPKVWGAVYLR